MDLVEAAASWELAGQAAQIYKLHRFLGSPDTKLPALVADVGAYGRMIGQVIHDVHGRPSVSNPRVWWTRHSTISTFLVLAGLMMITILRSDALGEFTTVDTWTSRHRVIDGAVGLGLVLCGVLYRRYGFWGYKRRYGDDDDTDADAVLLGSTGAAPATSEGNATQELRKVLAELRAATSHRPPNAPIPPGSAEPAGPDVSLGPAGAQDLDALRNFASSTTPQGPISATAFRQSQGRPPLPPPASPPPRYQPYDPQGAASLQEQAARLAEIHSWALSRQAAGPSWCMALWDAVGEMGLGLDETLRALVDSHGHTQRSAPGAGLGVDLATWARQGMGNTPALVRYSDMQLASEAVHLSELRYDNRLHSGLKPAASDVYIKLRSQGATSVRDWLTTQYGDAKSDRRWSDLWHAAVSIDFALAPCRDHAAVLAKLEEDDLLELHLRRLGAWVYERRTHDRVGAQRMLALPAPGSGVNVAPDWLVSEASLCFQGRVPTRRASAVPRHGTRSRRSRTRTRRQLGRRRRTRQRYRGCVF